MANLVIYCASQERAARVNSEIPDVVNVHPARVILLVADDESPSLDLETSVLVRPLHIGSHGFGFSEQVTLTAGRGAVHHLPFAVRALLIGDLPTNLWWARPVPPPFAGPILYELAEHASKSSTTAWVGPTRRCGRYRRLAGTDRARRSRPLASPPMSIGDASNTGGRC